MQTYRRVYSVARDFVMRVRRNVQRDGEPEREILRRFVASGSKPWSQGYEQFREDFVASILDDKTMMETFRTGGDLPSGYGIGLDERCVEYPWALARLPAGPGRLLDAGSTLNYQYLLQLPVLKAKRLHILTLFPELKCFWRSGVSYLFEDLRSIPVKDNIYDWIVCISTLEHIGFDNSIYTGDLRYRENAPLTILRAALELTRVLRPDGSLLLTVPYGTYQDLGFAIQFDADHLHKAINAFGCAVRTVSYFRYDSNGWQLSTPDGCSDRRFVDWAAAAWRNSVWPNPIPLEPDHAAAARAVACIHLIKSDSSPTRV